MTSMPLAEQGVAFLAGLVLLTSFVLLSQTRLVPVIYACAVQGMCVALVALLRGIVDGRGELLVSALLTFALKGLCIPWMLDRQLDRLALHRSAEVLDHQGLVLFSGAALVVFSYWVVLPLAQMASSIHGSVIMVSLAVVLLGLLMMVVRHQAMAQVVGFMAMENGLFLAAVAATGGMPLVVELGIAFDVLLAMVLFGIFFLHIRENIDSMDVDRLSALTEESGVVEKQWP